MLKKWLKQRFMMCFDIGVPNVLLTLVWGIGAVWGLSGCALHQPMSELNMLHEGRAGNRELGKHRAGLTVTGSFKSQDGNPDMRWCQGRPNCVITPVHQHQNGIGFYYTRMYGMSVTFGVGVIGADVTASLGRRLFLTLSGSAFAGGQAIVQRWYPLREGVGFAMGFGVRRWTSRFDVEPKEAGGGIFPWWYKQPVTAIGLRYALIAETPPDERNRRVGLTYTVFVGYAVTTRQPMFSLAIGLGGG